MSKIITLDHPDIFIPNRVGLERKLSHFSRANMRVVADFDGTMTQPKPTSWALLEQLERLMPGYIAASRAIYEEYHRYETHKEKEVKTQKMQEWWSKSLQLFAQLGMKKEYFENISVEDVMLREGIPEAFDFFKDHNIPVLILSAGVRQTIEMILSHYKIAGDHVSLTANKFMFDEGGNYTGVSPKGYIHAANKDEHHASHHAQSEFRGRSHIILLGDNAHDIHMIRPDERENTIAIGYCHDDEQEEVFRRIFDIIIRSKTSDLGVLQWLMSRISK